jgi:hypothetical protein
MDKKFEDFKKKEPSAPSKGTNSFNPQLTAEDKKNIQKMNEMYKLLDSILMEKAVTT